jgi:hypothetical protein
MFVDFLDTVESQTQAATLGLGPRRLAPPAPLAGEPCHGGDGLRVRISHVGALISLFIKTLTTLWSQFVKNIEKSIKISKAPEIQTI